MLRFERDKLAADKRWWVLHVNTRIGYVVVREYGDEVGHDVSFHPGSICFTADQLDDIITFMDELDGQCKADALSDQITNDLEAIHNERSSTNGCCNADVAFSPVAQAMGPVRENTGTTTPKLVPVALEKAGSGFVDLDQAVIESRNRS